MKAYLQRLSMGQITILVGTKLLDEIKSVVPFLESSHSSVEIDSSAYLKEIFPSFITIDLIVNSNFRKILLELLSERELASEFLNFYNSNLSYEENLELLLGYKWTLKNLSFCKCFLDVFELSLGLLPIETTNKLDSEYLHLSKIPYKQLKEFQLEVYLKSLKELEANSSKFLIQMPTGSGKTRTAMEVIVNNLNESKKGEYVIWLAHSVELCEQAEECFSQIWSHAGIGALKIYRAWGKNSGFPTDDDSKGFIIAGFDKIRSMLKKSNVELNKMNELCKLIVIDEAHKTIAPSYLDSISRLTGKTTKLIGLTATPGRSMDDDIENQKLSSFFNDTKLTFSSVGNPILFLKKEKILAHTTFEEIPGSEITLTKSQITNNVENDFSSEVLNLLGEDSARNVHILKSLIYECKNGAQIIYFSPSVSQSKFVASCLVFKGIKAFHIDASTSKETRSEKLNLFKSGEIQVICNFGVLTTGFDAPKTDVVFIARPTRSIVLYSQMIGRGLRGPKVGGKENCKIIQVKDNFTNFPEADDLFSYFDDYFHE